MCLLQTRLRDPAGRAQLRRPGAHRHHLQRGHGWLPPRPRRVQRSKVSKYFYYAEKTNGQFLCAYCQLCLFPFRSGLRSLQLASYFQEHVRLHGGDP